MNSARAELGAVQTRFEKSIENIDIQNENITAARGRIVDADFAKETANLSRTQILQQAGTAMVAQANQLPQQVLSLLK
ncbi:A-type flagellin [bioreactor metagenome]|uniref:A-type flagellin n=1 Tax=bioreactor metagenome TaxID=1076179 RepID=A0A645E1B7_9ZZZZ